jgi:hypothetical protein
MYPIDEWWSFIHTDTFDADWEDLELGDEDLVRLQIVLIDDPQAGDVITGTGGLRKLRFARPREGKSGSLRVCYAFFPTHGIVLFVAVYGKTSKADLTPSEKRYIRHLLEQFKAALDAE